MYYKNNPYNRKPEYKNYRVRSPVKSFRDLEVYQKTVLLSSDIFNAREAIRKTKRAGDARLLDEFEMLYAIAKAVPKLIAEAYGDRYSNFLSAINKLEEDMRIVSNAVTKIDCLIPLLESEEIKRELNCARDKYQKQRVKINNLRRAWMRIHEDIENKQQGGISQVGASSAPRENG